MRKLIEGEGVDRYVIGDLHEPTKEELLERYADKPVRGFLVVDVLGLDEEGARVFCYPDFELRNSDLPARVYIAEGSSKEESLHYLSQVIKKLKEGWDD